MNNIENDYCAILSDILENGTDVIDRTGVGTRKVFFRTLRHDLSKGFPLFTKKQVSLRFIAEELFFFLRGETNVKSLQDKGVTIWNEWAKENGDLGRIYGAQWRDWNGTDQIANVIQQIKSNPNSRRLLVNTWNVSELNEMALPPCHYAFQFYVENGKLSCLFNMRSVDLLLGFPYNIASYALLTHIIAKVCNLQVGEIAASLTDVHIYSNHFEAVKTYLSQTQYELPNIEICGSFDENLKDLQYSNIKLSNYKHSAKVSAPIAV